MSVPRELHAELGTRLKRPLGTDSLAMANALKWDVVSEFRKLIDAAKAKAGTHSLQQEALVAAEHLRTTRDDDWRQAALDGIVERAEQIRGKPIGEERDPISGHTDYQFDAARDARADEFAELAFGRATPIAHYHADFLKGERTKVRTKADDERALKYLLTWCASQEIRPTLQAINRRIAAKFMDEMREVAGDLAPVTLNKYLGRLSRYWQWLAKRTHVEANPWAGLRVASPKVADRDQERAFTDAEMVKLLTGPAPQKMQDLMRIAALTGARLEAVVDLRVKDCVEGLFTFKPQKKEPKARQVPVHPDLRGIVARRVRGKAPDDSLFPEWPAPKKAGSKRERSLELETAARIKTGKHGLARVTGGRGTATRTLALLGVIFSYAVRQGLRADNPVHGIEKHAYAERQRRASEAEYAALGEALRTMPTTTWPVATEATRFLALTGWRRGEMLALRWSEIDLVTRTARLAETKTGSSLRPLSHAACDILRALPRLGALVFPSSDGPDKPMAGYHKAWLRLATKASLPSDLTPHVLRHSFASIAADLHYSELTIAALLGHRKASVTSKYAHHADAVLLQAADAVAQRIVELMGGTRGSSEVVQFPSNRNSN